MKKIVSLVIACLLLLGLCACENGGPNVGNNNAAGENAPGGNKTYTLGDSAELHDVVVSLVDITESTGSDFIKPAAGKVYVLCEFEIANNSDEDLTVSSMLNFEAYCDDYSCDYSLGALMAKEDKDQLDGTVAAGKKMKGVVGYEVTTDWQELEVHYSINIFSDDEIVFVATSN